MQFKAGNVAELVKVCDALMQCDPVTHVEALEATVLETNKGRVAAFALHREVHATLTQIDRLFVHRVFRGRGNGKRLLNHLMEKKGGDFCLQVHVGNLRARKLYESFGFAETGKYNDFLDMYTNKSGQTHNETVWCYCRKPDDHSTYVECSGAKCANNNWVHVECGGDKEEEFFVCKDCKEEGERRGKKEEERNR